MKDSNREYRKEISRLNKKLFIRQKKRFEIILSLIQGLQFDTTIPYLERDFLTRKQERVILFNSIEMGSYNLSKHIANVFFKRNLRYAEKARMAKVHNSLEWIENHFPERVAELAAKANKKIAKNK
ncbi:MAG: hypothetical protein ACPGTS_01100 [Minisyncoccia bacterium]